MIVVRLMGGMGNQMFQYAAARALAHRLGAELRYELSYLGRASEGTLRHFELHHFRIVGAALSVAETLRFGSQNKASVGQRLVARVVRTLRPRHSYEEPGIAFDPGLLELPDDTVISGRFQSPFYFDAIAGILRDDFHLSVPASPKGQPLVERARATRSVGVHVRRTDYINNPTYANVIQALPLDYYDRALTHVRDRLGSDFELFIVSDDIAWCREQPVFQEAQVFVDLSDTAAPSVEEFEVLRNCRHFVISNSTFAWWAAWLSDAPDKLVIAPEQWSNNAEWDSVDRIPKTWITL
jgi:hypothetical protein